MIKNYKLPESWSFKKLGDIAVVTSSKRVFEAEWKTDGVPFYRAREIVRLAKQGFIDNELFISEQMFKEYSEKYGKPQENDIMITGVGTLGVCYLVKKNDKFYFKDGNIIWVKNILDSVFPKYLFYIINSELIQNQIKFFSAGNTVGTYTIENAKRTIIPLPSLEEQERIVKIIESKLTAVEKAKKASDEQLVNCDLLINKIYEEIFNKNKWKCINLEDLCLIERGGSPRPIENFLTNGTDGINWIKIGDAKLNSKYIDSTKEKIISEGSKHSRKVKRGDFILSNSMSFGRPYILNIDGCIHDGWLVLSDFSERIDKNFLFYILSSSIIKKQFENKARGAIVRNLNIDIVKKVNVPLPEINEQQQIVNIIESKLNAVEKVKNKINEQSTYINTLPSSILRKAFNGDY